MTSIGWIPFPASALLSNIGIHGHCPATLPFTVIERFKRFQAEVEEKLSLKDSNGYRHLWNSGGDSVTVSKAPPPPPHPLLPYLLPSTSWVLGPRQYLPGNNTALSKSNGRMSYSAAPQPYDLVSHISILFK